MHRTRQRFLASAAESDLLLAANLRTRVGYVIYPLSSQPNYPTQKWENIIELARRMSDRGETEERAIGHGLLRGPSMTETGIPESDLVPLATRDPEVIDRALQQQPGQGRPVADSEDPPHAERVVRVRNSGFGIRNFHPAQCKPQITQMDADTRARLLSSQDFGGG